jgi:(p)ppGpp synthase/HD superfamily hydrolase
MCLDTIDMKNLLLIAKKIAIEAHKHQYRRDGVTPYVTHLESVANAVESDLEKTVAWLHDILEDTSYREDDLLKYGINEGIILYVKILTKNQDTNYLQYILNIKSHEVTRRVKIADIEHNLSTLEKDKKYRDKRDKYKMALYILKN